ncbi:uncharacterized protein LOC143809290 isoform X2 [Ranitomeya variabilis]|uniref:uncharacterized protein LOC143809290 isoform X2 n=1 Tax=Ranitomeya variabilis TaxID=490064 RepID=UPI004055A4B8
MAAISAGITAARHEGEVVFCREGEERIRCSHTGSCRSDALRLEAPAGPPHGSPWTRPSIRNSLCPERSGSHRFMGFLHPVSWDPGDCCPPAAHLGIRRRGQRTFWTVPTFCQALACILFPDGWDSPAVRPFCNHRSDRYQLGTCSVHWGFILAILGTFDCLVLSILGFTLGKRHDALNPSDVKPSKKGFISDTP